MKEALIRIQIYYEIAMSIGNSPDLRMMLRESLSTYLRKLDCSAGVVIGFQEQPDETYSCQALFSIPRNVDNNSTFQAALKEIPQSFHKSHLPAFRESWPIIGSNEKKKFYYIMDLPDFGLLVLVKGSKPFEQSVIKSLKPLNRKLARACIACLQQKKIEEVLEQLKKENLVRKKVEEARRESEERFRSVFESAPLGIAITSPGGRFLNVNETFLEVLGYSKDDLKKLSFPDIIYPEDRERIEVLQKDIIAGKFKFYQTEKSCLRKDGRLLYTIARGTSISDGSGKLQYWLYILENITARKEAEKEKAKLEVLLRQAQKMETLGTLAGGIAHDFNNILTPILGFTEMAMDDLSPGSLVYNNLSQVLKATNRAQRLVRQILTFSRQGEQERQPVRIHLVVHEALVLLKEMLPSNIEIVESIDPGCGPVIADSTQIHQLVMNLCVNAYQAMQDKKGILGVIVEEVELNADSATTNLNLKTGTYIRLSISDTGHGMDKATIGRIFEPFFTTKAVNKGTGLGLAVVHGIILSHGGEITVTSTPGKGTTIHVYFPKAQKTG
jgi:PAS domain S-box-containing protein